MPSNNKLCTNLVHDSQMMTPNQQSGLCAVCHAVGFVSLTSEACELSYTKSHFHIGALKHIAKKTFCPGCRLIISAARSTDGNYDTSYGESEITLERCFISARDQKPGHDLHEDETTKGNTVWFDEALHVEETLHMESLIEVIVHRYVGRFDKHKIFDLPRVTGTIIMAEEAKSVQSSALKRLESIRKMFIHSMEPFSVRGRDVPPKVNMNLIKHWMQSCSVQHGRCRIPTFPTVKQHTIRLIDVRDYRITSATFKERFVALSYVWGSRTTPLLTRNTLSNISILDGLRNLTIPQTITDAIQLVRDIDERYLWVDSLCIMQDDNDDKLEQLPIMADVYSNAELVIVATAGSDVSAGLPGICDTSRSTSQRTEEINGVRFITACPAVRQVLDWSVWNSRGWTLQEAVQSRRALVFTEGIVYWNCSIAKCREDLSCESSSARLKSTEKNLLPGFLTEVGTYPIGAYCQMIQAFSLRKFRDESDIIWALVGLLRLQASNFQQGFIWGLPHESLDDTLLWSEASSCRRVHKRNALHTVVTKTGCYDFPYPTWSWLSVGNSVSFQHVHDSKVVSKVTWHPPIKLGDQRFATYLESIHLKGSSDSGENQLNSNLLARSSSEEDIMGFGLLVFTARTALLILKSSQKPSSLINKRNEWIEATVHSPITGEELSTLKVPNAFLRGESERPGEFVLLSSNTINNPEHNNMHKDGCACSGTYNVMLIEWNGAVAYRQTIGEDKGGKLDESGEPEPGQGDHSRVAFEYCKNRLNIPPRCSLSTQILLLYPFKDIITRRKPYSSAIFDPASANSPDWKCQV